MVVVGWCYPTISEEWGREGTPWRPNSRAKVAPTSRSLIVMVQSLLLFVECRVSDEHLRDI